nr:oligosaccharide flippase family protein [Clostridium paraputrificum]
MKALIEKVRKLPVAMKATLAFLFCNIIQKSISLITVPIFTRMLTTEQFGLYSVYTSWLSIFTLITTLNLNFGVFNKGMTKFKKDKDGYTLTMQTLTTIITTIVLIIYLIFRNSINAITELSTFITLAMLVELYFTPAISFWLIRQRYDFKYKMVIIITLMISVGNALLGVFAVIMSDDKGIARILSCVIIQICFGLGLYIYNLIKGKKIFNWKYARFALVFNIPLIPHYMSTYILDQSDRIIIQKLCGVADAGIYSVAYSAATVIKIVTNSINNSLIPWQYRKLENKEYSELENKTFPIICTIAAILIVFVAFAPEVMKILASKEYYGAVKVIPPVACSTFFIFLYGLFGNIEFFYDANKFTMYISILGAIVNIVLNYLFIPKLGFIAAAYTTLICYIIFTLLHYIYMNKVTKKKIGIVIFNSKKIFIVSFLFTLGSLVMSLLYENIIIRYLIIILVMTIMIKNINLLRDKVKILIKNK